MAERKITILENGLKHEKHVLADPVVDSISDALEMATLRTCRYEYDDLVTDDSPLGWRIGYYDGNTGVWKSSGYFLATASEISTAGKKRIRVTPADTLAVALTCFKPDGSFDVIGNANTSNFPEYAGMPREVDCSAYERIGITVGRYASSSGSHYKNKDAIDAIVCEITDYVSATDTERRIASVEKAADEIKSDYAQQIELLKDVRDALKGGDVPTAVGLLDTYLLDKEVMS